MTADPPDPAWLQRLRPLAKQRPRTQFVKVRWHDLQQLLRERDLLVGRADPGTLAGLEALDDDYGRS